MQTVIAPDGVYLPALGRPVEAGEEVEVPDEIATALVAQGWTTKRSAAAKKAARKRASATDAESTDDDPADAGEEEE